MIGFVYIIRDKVSSRLYVGSTSNLTRHIYQHNHGHTQTTRRMKSRESVFSQSFNSLSDARKIEARIKKLKRKDYLEKIIEEGYIRMRN